MAVYKDINDSVDMATDKYVTLLSVLNIIYKDTPGENCLGEEAEYATNQSVFLQTLFKKYYEEKNVSSSAASRMLNDPRDGSWNKIRLVYCKGLKQRATMVSHLSKGIEDLANCAINIRAAAYNVYSYVACVQFRTRYVETLQDGFAQGDKHDFNLSAKYLAEIIYYALDHLSPGEDENPQTNRRYLDYSCFAVPKALPEGCDNFRGRENILAEIDTLMPTGERAVLSLSGWYYIGKSEVALHYAKDALRKNKYSDVIYVEYADDLASSILSSFKLHIDSVNPDNKPTWDTYNYFLKQLGPTTLMIINHYVPNDSDDSVLQEVLSYNCHIIFTTVLEPDACPSKNSIEVGPLPMDDLRALILTSAQADSSDIPVIDEIIRTVEYNTGLVALSANQFNAPRRKSLEELLECYKKNIVDVNNGKIRLSHGNTSALRKAQLMHVETVLQLDKVLGMDATDDTVATDITTKRHFLQALSLCPRNGVHFDVLRDALGSPSNYDDVFDIMVDLAYIKFDWSTKVIYLPAPVRDLIYANEKYRAHLSDFLQMIDYFIVHTDYSVAVPTIMNAGNESRCVHEISTVSLDTIVSMLHCLDDNHCPSNISSPFIELLSKLETFSSDPLVEFRYYFEKACRSASSFEEMDKLFNQAHEVLLKLSPNVPWQLGVGLFLRWGEKYLFVANDGCTALQYIMYAQELIVDLLNLDADFDSEADKINQCIILSKILEAACCMYIHMMDKAREILHFICQSIKNKIEPQGISPAWTSLFLVLLLGFGPIAEFNDIQDIYLLTKKCLIEKYGDGSLPVLSLEKDYQNLCVFRATCKEENKVNLETVSALTKIFDTLV